MLDIIGDCVFCDEDWTVTVDETSLLSYIHGIATAQEAFPQLTATERECMISGICPACQKKIFGEQAKEG